MKTYLKYLYVALFGVCIIYESFSQPFSLDETFQSSYIFRNYYDNNEVGAINKVIELEDGSLRLSGGFFDPFNPNRGASILKLSSIGGYDPSFFFPGYGGSIKTFRYQDYLYLIGQSGTTNRLDIQTGALDSVFWYNKNSSNWDGTINNMFLFPNGDFLLSGWVTYHYGLPDAIGSAIARIDKDGFYDTTFHHDADGPIGEFLKYDTNRVLITGTFEAYDFVPRYRAARIFNDGSIDTSFHSIYTGGSSLRPLYIQPDGKIIMGGAFYIQGFDKIIAIARLHPDGSLDSTFNNFNNVQSELGLLQNITAWELEYYVNTCCPTPNNKYLFGGGFRYCQGKYRGRIVLTNYNGFLDTTVFTGSGIDSALGYPSDYGYGIATIIPAQNEKYYVAGRFSGLNGQMVEPIIRLNPHDHVGIEEQTEEHGLMICPNPARDKINIKSNRNIEEIEIYNLEGQLLQITKPNKIEESIDVSTLPPGYYFIRATGRDEVFVRKFVVVR
ncbi:MAG: T9SS type A sorting domain-containing protein [Bacteroidales bacterium]|nr:T9SS type A sorting domain-containing protein [Bacteroidales bacterium]MCF8456080.1 T9SS type A sorting domain-containing protein [Bacteroidales bacterium]